jgi:hypothetical protein
MPFRCEPEAAVIVLAACKAKGSDDLVCGCLQAKGPGPFVATLDCGKKNVAIEALDAVRRVGPRNARVEVLHDLPLREEELYLLGVFELKRAEQEAFGLEGGRHKLVGKARLLSSG